MDLVHMQSKPRRTPFAVEWFYTLGEDTIEGVDFKKVAKIILKKEKEILKKFPPSANGDGYTGLGPNSLTSRWESYNIFSWDDEEILKLRQKIYEKYMEFMMKLNVPRMTVYIQCWANVLRDGQKIEPHLHNVGPYSYLSGHVCIQCEDTSTMYINPVNQINKPEEYASKNEVGKFTIFQDCIPHYTTEHKGKKERITIAFDIVVEEFLHQKSNPEHYEPFDEVL
jgi:hypothetical protein